MDVEIIGPRDIAVHTPRTVKPTEVQYRALQQAFDHFDRVLIEPLLGVKLPPALITMQRQNKLQGSFTPKRFISLNGEERTDEIALNPRYFHLLGPREVCSTMVHEMLHSAQFHFGKPMKGGYHDRAWGAAMKAVGLWPSSTGKPGGRETGHRVAEYVVEGGPFALAFEQLDAEITWGDVLRPEEEGPPPRPKRIKFVCPGCGWNYLTVATNAGWGACRPCGNIEMVAA